MEEILLKYWPLILAAVGALLAWGEIKGNFKAMGIKLETFKEDIQKDIGRLEAKQDKYNHLQERVIKLETWKEEHEKGLKK